MFETIGVAGSPAVRGEDLGRRRADAIARWLTGWLRSIGRAGIADPECHVVRMQHGAGYMQAIRARAPDLLEEVEGIARGAALPLDLVLAGQMMDEEWEYRRRVIGHPRPDKCTSFAIRDGDTTCIGQNMDLDPFTDGHQLLLRIGEYAGQPKALIFSVGGMIGLMGVNDAGVGVCVNALPDLPGQTEGLPVAFVIRKLLQHASAAAAADWLAHVPHATPQHYLIADPGEIRSVEVSLGGLQMCFPADVARAFHTNHALTSAPPAVSTAYRVNSHVRLEALTARLGQGIATTEQAMAALASRDDPVHPICRLVEDGTAADVATTSFTTGAMICRLREGGTSESWFSAGPPSKSGFDEIRMD